MENGYNNDTLNFHFTNKSDNTKTNIKRIKIIVYKGNNIISSVKYYSANIGHIKIGSVLW